MIRKLIIVLGYTLTQSCAIQPILQSRLEEALLVYQPGDTFLVCGKMPPKILNPTRCEKLSEAEAMKQYLLEKGISEKSILKEEKSTSTLGNAFYSLEFIQKQKSKPILIISNEFHYPSVKYCFNKVLGNQYSYSFKIIPDSSLGAPSEEIEKWKSIISKMTSTYYPLLLTDMQNGDTKKLKDIIEGPVNPTFKTYLKELFNLDDSADLKEFICG